MNTFDYCLNMAVKKKSIPFAEFLSQYCSEEWVLLAQSFVQTQVYKKGARIFNEGEKVKNIYYINSGKIKVTSLFNDKDERIMRLSNPGDFLGHRAFISDKFPISAQTLEEATITAIPIDIFMKLLKANSDLAIHLLEFYARDLRVTEERMMSIIHNDVIIRVGIVLCMLIDIYGYDSEKSRRLAFMLSRSDIANFAGTVYESVVRNLAKLEEMGLIRIEGKNILILKEKELRKFISKKEHSA